MPLQPQGRLPPLGARFEPGWYLGPVDGQAQSFVMTETGVARARTIRRRPPGERWNDSELLEKGTATVLQPNKLNPGEARIGIRAPVHLPDPVGLPPLPSEGGPRQVRRVRLLRTDFATHGFTLGCPGCENIRGGSRVAVGHSERCRDRMQTILAQSDGPGRRRMEEAAQRVTRAGASAEDGGPEQEPKRRRVGESAVGSPAVGQADGMEVDPGQDRGGADATPSPPSSSSSSSTGSPISAASSTSASTFHPAPESAKRDAVEGDEPAAKRLRGEDDGMEGSDRDVDLMLIWSGDDGPCGAICEVYSPPRVAAAAEKLGEVPGWSLDLTTSDGQGRAWDFDDPACRRRAVELLERTRPFLLVGSPMCTWFSTLMSLNFPRMSSDEVRRGLGQARRHLAFTFYLYGLQLRGGRHFLHEHPAGASSWKEPCVVDFAKAHPGLYTTVSHMCRFGMESTLADRKTMAPVAKPTRWLTSSRCVAERLSLRCQGGHQHATLLSGRARAAQVYPPALCKAIVKGAAAERAREEKAVDPPGSCAWTRSPHSPAQVPTFNLELLRVDPEDDGHVAEELDEEFDEGEWEAEDDVKGGSLPPLLVHRGRRKEIDYLQGMKVYGYSTVREALRVTGKPPVKLKWIDTNKGGRDDPEVRSRLVCTEVRRKDQVPIFSATPPLETLRVLVARLASEDPRGQEDPFKAVHVDVSRAHFYADAVRDVYIEVPREDPRSQEPGVCGKLQKTMYGTLDAAEQWGEHYSCTLVDADFAKGKASPCHFLYERLGLWVLVHGDDFFGVARRAGREFLVKTLKAKYEIKVKEAGPQDSDAKEMKVLGRILSFRPDGVTLEADPCQAEQAVEDLGLRAAKGVDQPKAGGGVERGPLARRRRGRR